jgi:hypothetical protein
VAQEGLARLAKLGIDLGKITERSLADGITALTHVWMNCWPPAEANLKATGTEANVETALTNNRLKTKNMTSQLSYGSEVPREFTPNSCRTGRDRFLHNNSSAMTCVQA